MDKIDQSLKEFDGEIIPEELEVLKQAQSFYESAKYQEAIDLIESHGDPVEPNFFSCCGAIIALRLLGWSFYYRAIKGPESEKMKMLEFSRKYFGEALDLLGHPAFFIVFKSEHISILNGYPLVLWILGEKKEALKISEEAMIFFPTEASVFNTRGILCRWAERYEESISVLEKVASLSHGDFLLAGHAKHNQGDAFMKLDKKTRAKSSYEQALKYYELFEKETGRQAKIHIEGVNRKLNELEN